MEQLPAEVIELFKDPTAVKVLATVDEQGTPHVVFKGSLTVLEDGSLAYVEALESSRTNGNMLRSIWFDRRVAVSIRGQDGLSYQIKGKPARYVITGPLFKQFFREARERMGPEGDIAGVWIITPEEVRNESFAVRKQEEEEKHPFFRHFDRLKNVLK